jgi:hypothetical protein
MRISPCLLAPILCAALLAEAPAQEPAQEPAPPSSESPARPADQGQALPDPVYVRRFSAGVSLTVLPRNPLIVGNETIVTQSPAVQSVYRSQTNTPLTGYGVSAQLALTDRFALHSNLFVRKVLYIFNSDIHTGVDNPATIIDERRYHAEEEDSRARYYDLPVMVRFYGKSRYDPGPRWFVQGGAAIRRVDRVKSSLKITDGTVTNCCIETPIPPANRTVRGLVAGAGFQVTDPLGIRLVPEFRYTRWSRDTFNNIVTRTRRHQLEIVFSFTF